MNFKPTEATWLHDPQHASISDSHVEFLTSPGTDFWQRSYYGFRNDNAPALLVECRDNFTFTARLRFTYAARFDQCGIIVYEDSENWCKASIEHENEEYSRLGSVVTNLGYSDWATSDIAPVREIWYRLSRRGPDFLLERSFDGAEFRQMRIFHLHCLGETTAAMGHADPPLAVTKAVHFGLYACSPLDSSFTVRCDKFSLEPNIWRAHVA